MFSEDKVTDIFCLADEFCKFFDAQQEKSMLKAPQDGKRHRRKPNRMSDAEIIVILIHLHSGGFRCFKHYYLHYICKHSKIISNSRYSQTYIKNTIRFVTIVKSIDKHMRYLWFLLLRSNNMTG